MVQSQHMKNYHKTNGSRVEKLWKLLFASNKTESIYKIIPKRMYS